MLAPYQKPTLSSVNVSRKRSSGNTDVTQREGGRKEGWAGVSFFIPSSSFINQCGVEASVGDDQNEH